MCGPQHLTGPHQQLKVKISRQTRWGWLQGPISSRFCGLSEKTVKNLTFPRQKLWQATLEWAVSAFLGCVSDHMVGLFGSRPFFPHSPLCWVKRVTVRKRSIVCQEGKDTYIIFTQHPPSIMGKAKQFLEMMMTNPVWFQTSIYNLDKFVEI